MTGTAWLDEVGALSLPIGIKPTPTPSDPFTAASLNGQSFKTQNWLHAGTFPSLPKRGTATSTTSTAHT
jgi:hypothetical protein